MNAEIEKITQLATIADAHADEVAQIEQEVNRLTGGDATVAEVVAIMISIGWATPGRVEELRRKLGEAYIAQGKAELALENKGARARQRRDAEFNRS